MRVAAGWRDFALLDASEGEKLERWGEVTLIRPDPQVIWNTPRGSAWSRADAHYRRSASGGGQWELHSLTKQEWTVLLLGFSLVTHVPDVCNF